jgi:hypothetical protein
MSPHIAGVAGAFGGSPLGPVTTGPLGSGAVLVPGCPSLLLVQPRTQSTTDVKPTILFIDVPLLFVPLEGGASAAIVPASFGCRTAPAGAARARVAALRYVRDNWSVSSRRRPRTIGASLTTRMTLRCATWRLPAELNAR